MMKLVQVLTIYEVIIGNLVHFRRKTMKPVYVLLFDYFFIATNLNIF